VSPTPIFIGLFPGTKRKKNESKRSQKKHAAWGLSLPSRRVFSAIAKIFMPYLVPKSG